MLKNITLLAFLASIMSLSLQAQTTSINGGDWEAWIGPPNAPNITADPTDPLDWRSDLTTTVGWGVPTVGAPNEYQALNVGLKLNSVFGFNNVFGVNDDMWNAPLTPITHYVWGIPNQWTTYYRLIFNVGEGDDCNAYNLLTSADNQHTVWLNGVQIGTQGQWDDYLDLAIPGDFLVCGENIITVQAIEADGLNTPHFFIGQLNQDPAADCCHDEIDVDRLDCETLSFTLRNELVNKSSIIWTLDGVVIPGLNDLQTATFTLSPGLHEICASYFGTRYPCETDICCGETCVQIDIPIPVSTEETLTICDLGNGDPLTLQYDPCFGATDFDYYTALIITYDANGFPIMTPHDSRVDGCLVTLGPGTHGFNFFDENDCLVRSVTMTVLVEQATETVCEQTVDLICGSNLDLTHYEDCPECTPDMLFSWGDWKKVVAGPDEIVTNTMLSNVTQSATYRRIHEDPLNCKKCVIVVHVKVERLYEEVNVTLTQPNCDWLFDLGSLNQLLQMNNPDWCNGTYTDLQIVQTDMDLVPTGFNLNVVAGLGYALDAGFIYTIRPTDPNSCCEVRFRVICDEGMAPPPMNGHDNPYTDVFEGAVFSKENSNSQSSVVAGNQQAAVGLTIVPNPTSNVFRIETIDKTAQAFDEIIISDLNGTAVQTYANVDSDKTYSLNGLASGIYSVSVRRGEIVDQLILTMIKQ